VGFNPLGAALGILDDLIPDADKRDAAKAQIRLGALAANSQWGPQGIGALVTLLALVAYLSAATWIGALFHVYVAVVWELVWIWFALVLVLYGIDLRELGRVVGAVGDAVKRRRNSA